MKWLMKINAPNLHRIFSSTPKISRKEQTDVRIDYTTNANRDEINHLPGNRGKLNRMETYQYSREDVKNKVCEAYRSYLIDNMCILHDPTFIDSNSSNISFLLKALVFFHIVLHVIRYLFLLITVYHQVVTSNSKIIQVEVFIHESDTSTCHLQNGQKDDLVVGRSKPRPELVLQVLLFDLIVKGNFK
jgi:hypothetical protein